MSPEAPESVTESCCRRARTRPVQRRRGGDKHLAQLAVDRSLQGQGLGGELLLDALITLAAAAPTVGRRLVVVDAVAEGAVAFHERYGFIRIGDGLRLYQKIARIESSLLRGLRLARTVGRYILAVAHRNRRPS